MKNLLIAMLAMLLATAPVDCLSKQKESTPEMYAHRGCWSSVTPENSLAAVKMAKRYGYKGIECDVHYTKDKKLVILHDATLNRTARLKDGYRKLDKPVKLADLTLEELRRDYVLASPDPKLRTPIPTLEELLKECKRQKIVPMLHSNIVESYRVAQELFGDEWIAFTGNKEALLEARKFSNCMILLSINEGTAEQTIAKLMEIGGRCGISSMKYRLYTPEFCNAITSAGYEVQASIFPQGKEDIAQANGITYQLTDFSFMPNARQKPFKLLVGDQDSSSWATRNFGYAESIQNGALVIELEFKGEVEVRINDKAVYKLSASEAGTKHTIGRRFIDTTPKVEIIPVNPQASVTNLNIELYKF